MKLQTDFHEYNFCTDTYFFWKYTSYICWTKAQLETLQAE